MHLFNHTERYFPYTILPFVLLRAAAFLSLSLCCLAFVSSRVSEHLAAAICSLFLLSLSSLMAGDSLALSAAFLNLSASLNAAFFDRLPPVMPEPSGLGGGSSLTAFSQAHEGIAPGEGGWGTGGDG